MFLLKCANQLFLMFINAVLYSNFSVFHMFTLKTNVVLDDDDVDIVKPVERKIEERGSSLESPTWLIRCLHFLNIPVGTGGNCDVFLVGTNGGRVLTYTITDQPRAEDVCKPVCVSLLITCNFSTTWCSLNTHRCCNGTRTKSELINCYFYLIFISIKIPEYCCSPSIAVHRRTNLTFLLIFKLYRLSGILIKFCSILNIGLRPLKENNGQNHMGLEKIFHNFKLYITEPLYRFDVVVILSVFIVLFQLVHSHYMGNFVRFRLIHLGFTFVCSHVLIVSKKLYFKFVDNLLLALIFFSLFVKIRCDIVRHAKKFNGMNYASIYG
uniref:Uncharacterized protein n=1 Tax=Heterorhabditis bacteriophora TaxID=37862 RepID=A0A1I7WTF6_HETBA